ncbi:hypothetical protein GCM10009868_34380 [Terrabacter aerolatus]|uniref:DUF3800 domain-containing protein n=1 Tax=Terrabacter aerolatus TaxID=422442 RepID=A0A512CWK2_9MICO|nr:DUF3800 domain-containing protein [Terrabacter aerolatus]GEO28577.1 hypothetical protein TAE01_03870 [Terrabacter aerolatus]
MPSAAPARSAVLLEVACDESGSEGEKLVHGSTDTFAHASVDVTTAAALATIERVRVEARSPATEVKASVVLRPQNRRLLEWLLGEDGPLLGHAHVHLTDKALHLTGRLVALLGDGETSAHDVAGRSASVHRTASRRLGRAGWEAVLADFNDVVRARSLDDAVTAAGSLRRGLDQVAHLDPGLVPDLVSAVPRDPEGLLALVARGRGALDPIVPALAEVLHHWGATGRPLWVVHDVQAALTDAAIRTAVGASADGSAEWLEGIRFVDSQDDARVQLADFLAGAARRIASNVLAGQSDPGLVALVAPYVSSRSTWLDAWPG